MSLLDIRNLCIKFGQFEAVKNANINIEQGKIVALVGESGSGKSVTALSVIQLVSGASQSGSIKFSGQELVQAPQKVLQEVRGKKIGMIFQEPMTSLNPLHTIGKQIAEVITIHNPALSRSEVLARVKNALCEVELDDLVERLSAYPHELSGGQRQRVMIAIAIANEPELLIADEPTTALDVIVAAEILKLLVRLKERRNMSILLITHDLTIVENLSDNVYVMRRGEIVESGVTKKIFENPKHEYTKTLLGSAPQGRAVKTTNKPVVLVKSEKLNVSYNRKTGFFGMNKNTAHVLKDVDISIAEGKTIGVAGESGSGKTTLGMALLRLVKSQGRIGYLGQKVNEMPRKDLRNLRRQMQVVFQDPYASLNPRLTIREIIEEGPKAHKIKVNAEELLQEVGLTAEMANRYPHEFSGGQRQRIGIARALAMKPRFIVLDEPTSALDLTVQSQIVDLLKKLQERYKISYLFITHDLRVMQAIAHEIIIMKDGRIIEQGNAEQIFKKPQAEYTKALIKAAFLG